MARNNVFGVGHKLNREGAPQEQGLGSFDNPTLQSVEAYQKNQTERRQGGPESGFEENLKRMKARLAAVDEQRRKDRAAAGDDLEENF